MRRLGPLLALLAAVSGCTGLDAGRPLVVDIGHSPEAPGAISASGATEHSFNQRFALRLADRLPAAGLAPPRIVAIAGPDPLLDRRVAEIAEKRPCLVLSIHHDSVQERYLRIRTVDGVERQYTDHASGFSLFVPDNTAMAPGSRMVARAISDALMAAGERPSLHHAEPIEGESRLLLDPGRGIYTGDFLKILRTAAAPIVLIEVGVIKNPADEARLAMPSTIERLADAIAVAVASQRVCTVSRPPAARTSG